jgi:hypothetical protein
MGYFSVSETPRHMLSLLLLPLWQEAVVNVNDKISRLVQELDGWHLLVET